jgi:hypothetical protein
MRAIDGLLAPTPLDMGSVSVKKVEEYYQNAAECREVARTAPPAHRQQLEEMAATWERLAQARRHRLDISKQRLKRAGRSV